MSPFALVFPMLALVVLTFGVSVSLFRARLRSVREGHTPVSYFRVFQGSPEPEFLAKPTRHYVNLFETPVLFYAGCLAAMVTGVTGPVVVALAWGYVAARLGHAWVHLGANRVRHRLRVFLLGWLCLLGLWIRCAWESQRGRRRQQLGPLPPCRDTASQLLEAYCSLDFDGARLGSTTGEQIWSMVAWENEPGWDAVKLVEGFTIGAPQASGNRIEIPVIYEVVGTAAGPQVARFGKELETVKFELESTGGTWKITGPIIPPHVSLAAHERALAER